jgi:hypothetical protein
MKISIPMVTRSGERITLPVSPTIQLNVRLVTRCSGSSACVVWSNLWRRGTVTADYAPMMPVRPFPVKWPGHDVPPWEVRS